MPFDDDEPRRPSRPTGRNVLGGSLLTCSVAPMTGFLRTGCCDAVVADHGSHTVCAVMTDVFLRFSRERGNDLSTARPEFDFAGLREGDRWCLCAPRWQEALEAGVAPPVVLQATEKAALAWCSLDDLLAHATG